MTNLAPIILFCYNRPWHVEQTLEALSNNDLASKSVLYIYCDGPKENASEEMIQKVTDVRQVVRKRKWCGEVHVVEREHNVGLMHNIVDGVTQIVNQYGRVIVFEDDMLTSPGTLQAKKQFVNTKKATKSLQLFCRLTQNVNVSPWALNSSQKIRSTTGLL